MKSANILAIVLLIVGLGAGFFGGMQYQKSQVSQNSAQRTGAGRAGGGQGRFGQGNGGGAVVGNIISQDDKSITVGLQDGSSKIVLLSDTTTISKSDTGSKTDLKTGERVAVFGTSNSDGSVTALNVQINPMMRFGSASPRPAQSQ